MKSLGVYLVILTLLMSVSTWPTKYQDKSKSHVDKFHMFKEDFILWLNLNIEDVLMQFGEICDEENIKLTTQAREVFERIAAVDERSASVCSLINNNIEHVFAPLTEKVDYCANDSLIGPIGSFLIKSIKSVQNYVCKSQGEKLMEFFNPCIQIWDLESTPCFEEFEGKVQSIVPFNGEGTFLQQYCRLLGELKPCLEPHLQKCKLHITRNAYLDLYDAVIEPCKIV